MRIAEKRRRVAEGVSCGRADGFVAARGRSQLKFLASHLIGAEEEKERFIRCRRPRAAAVPASIASGHLLRVFHEID